jgi:hypothetical protein
VRVGRQRGHVVHRARPVVDVSEHQHRDIAVERSVQAAGLDGTHARALAEHAAQPLDDVQIGRKVVDLGEDRPAAVRELERGGQQLEEVDGRGVRDDDLAGLGTDEPRDAVADAARPADPVVAVPAADEVTLPVLQHARHLARRRRGLGAERVAVQVDHARRQNEPRAAGRERIACVHRLRHGPGDDVAHVAAGSVTLP